MHIKIELKRYTKSRAVTSAKFDRGRISLKTLQVSSGFELFINVLLLSFKKFKYIP